jgi:hypothetical protein
MRPLPLTRRGSVPDYLVGGYTFDWVSQPPTSVDNAVLRFSVEKSGIVYLTADRNYEGNSQGGWRETCQSREQLIEAGWEYLGRCPWIGDEFKPVELYRKHCEAGERYEIRVNKYGPPRVHIPPPR